MKFIINIFFEFEGVWIGFICLTIIITFDCIFIFIKEEYDIYTKTLEFLSLAKENLQQKYVAPIKDRFNYYSLKLEKALNQKTYMDRDFKISFESKKQTINIIIIIEIPLDAVSMKNDIIPHPAAD